MASGFPQAVEESLREPAPRLSRGPRGGLRRLRAVEALAVAAEDVLGLERRQASAGGLEAQERVDADRSSRRGSSPRAERVAADEDPLRRRTRGRSRARRGADDRDHDERRACDLGRKASRGAGRLGVRHRRAVPRSWRSRSWMTAAGDAELPRCARRCPGRRGRPSARRRRRSTYRVRGALRSCRPPGTHSEAVLELV